MEIYYCSFYFRPNSIHRTQSATQPDSHHHFLPEHMSPTPSYRASPYAPLRSPAMNRVSEDEPLPPPPSPPSFKNGEPYPVRVEPLKYEILWSFPGNHGGFPESVSTFEPRRNDRPSRRLPQHNVAHVDVGSERHADVSVVAHRRVGGRVATEGE